MYTKMCRVSLGELTPLVPSGKKRITGVLRCCAGRTGFFIGYSSKQQWKVEREYLWTPKGETKTEEERCQTLWGVSFCCCYTSEE